MPGRAVTITLAVLSASAGFVAGRFTPTEKTPVIDVRQTLSRAKLPVAPALPVPPPRADGRPDVPPSPRPAPAATQVAPPRAPSRSAASKPETPAAPSTVPPRAPSLLSAFRFQGIGPGGGLRLARVRPGTLPAALGLQSGDELLTINDFRLSDPEQALTAYARLRYADRLELAIARNGRPTAIVYSVR